MFYILGLIPPSHPYVQWDVSQMLLWTPCFESHLKQLKNTGDQGQFGTLCGLVVILISS